MEPTYLCSTTQRWTESESPQLELKPLLTALKGKNEPF
jgi:hypothetical protein